MAQIRAVIDRLIGDGSANVAADGSRHDARTVSISVGEGEALTRWVRREKAVQTIEIGLAFGVSALHICEDRAAHGRGRRRPALPTLRRLLTARNATDPP